MTNLALKFCLVALLLTSCAHEPTNMQYTVFPKWESVQSRSQGHVETYGSLKAINSQINKIPYKTDQEIYGVTDYWAAPAEFFKNGGDCEDYAIAKYYTILKSGLARAEDMRLVMAWDYQTDNYHAVLVVGGKVLDNTTSDIVPFAESQRYKFLYVANKKSPG